MAEIIAKRNRFQKVFEGAEPGRFTAEVHSGPIHFMHKDTDQWTDVSELFDGSGITLGKDVQFGIVNRYMAAWRGARYLAFRPSMMGYFDTEDNQWHKLADASYTNVSRNGESYLVTDIFSGINMRVLIRERRMSKRFEIAVRPNFPSPASLGMNPSTTLLIITYDVDDQTGVTPVVEETGLPFSNGTVVHSDLVYSHPSAGEVLRLMRGSFGDAAGVIHPVYFAKSASIPFAEAIPFTQVAQAEYPIWIDPTSTVYSGTEDGYISTPGGVVTNSVAGGVGETSDGCGTDIDYRSYVRFDLAGITGTCNSASLNLYKFNKLGIQSVIAKLYTTDWGPTLAAGDRGQAGTDEDTDAMAGAGYTAFTCDSTRIEGKFGDVASFELRPLDASVGNNTIGIYLSDETGTGKDPYLSIDYTEDVVDTEDPVITITSPTSDPTYGTASATIDISGTASDDTAVTEVTWVNSAGGSGTATGTDNWSIDDISLSEGENVITVTAVDAAANEGTDTLTVTYTVPAPPATPTDGSLGWYRGTVFDGIRWKRFVK